MSEEKRFEVNRFVPAIRKAVKRKEDRIIDVGRFIHAHPEPGGKEKRAAKRITACLREFGFEVEMPWGGMSTAFRARISNGNDRPCIAVLAEYDALEGLGHGCGHNLITVAALSAACGMAHFLDGWKGRFEVIGTPAEELLGGKCRMAERGAFDHLDACFMTHPSATSRATMPSNALQSFHAVFHGRAAHAAIAPRDGVNALDAAILFFQHLHIFLFQNLIFHFLSIQNSQFHNKKLPLRWLQIQDVSVVVTDHQMAG